MIHGVKDQSVDEHFTVSDEQGNLISGIDTTKFWLPDYSNIQKANKKVIRLLEDRGYTVSNLTYRKTQKR